MTQLVLMPAALADLERIRDFLLTHDPDNAEERLLDLTARADFQKNPAYAEALGWLRTTLLDPAVSSWPAWLSGLLLDGIYNGVATVAAFVPIIILFFLFMAVVEDSGYLSRAAYLMDRLLVGLGLSGKSFIPLLSSFACAIPGIMAARTIENRRDRLLTIFLAPLMSCSARLPVYVLMTGAFVPDVAVGGIPWIRLPALVLLSLYALGVVVAALVASRASANAALTMRPIVWRCAKPSTPSNAPCSSQGISQLTSMVWG